MTNFETSKTSRYILGGLVVLLLASVPVLQRSTNPMDIQTASATGGIVLNNVQSTSGTASSSPYQITISNFNAGTSSNQLLVVGVEANNQFVNSVTFGGVSLTKELSSFHNNYAAFWYLKNPSGTGNIVVTMNGATSVVVGAYAFSGVDQTTPLPTSASNYNTASSSPTISLTTQYSNSWVLDSPAIYGGVTLGSPTCTQEWDINIASAITGASSYKTTSSPGSVTCSWTASNGDLWDDVAVEVKAAGSSGSGSTTASTGIVIPLYCYPYGSSSGCANATANYFNWQGINNTKNDYPHVPLFVKINPSSGPGSSFDSNYARGIANLTKAGVIVTGYVPTNQCLDSTSSVETEIDDYKNWYQQYGLTGISFDEMPNTTGCESYYQTLTNYAKQTDGMTVTIGNPGASIPSSYIGTVDKMNIYENSVLPSTSTLQSNTFANSNTTGYDKHNFTFEAYSQSSLPSAQTVGNYSNFVGLMDITSGSGTNPWNTIQTYLDTLAADLNKNSEIVTIKAVNTGGSQISGEFITAMQNGNQIPSGSAPLNYNGTSGVTYTFVPQPTSNCLFDKWQDTGSTTAARAITVGSSSQTYTAVYQNNGANTCQ